MKKWFDTWYNMYAVMALTAAIVLGGYEWVSWGRLSPSDWGTWLGAIGTVATLAMTIVLATDASRTKRKEQLDLALVSTAGFLVRARDVVRALASLRNALRQPLALPDDIRPMFADYVQKLDEYLLWKADELVPMVSLPNRIAARFAWIGSKIRTEMTILRELSEEADPPSFDLIALVARTSIYELNFILKEIEVLHGECTQFLLAYDFHYVAPTYNPAFDEDIS